MMHFRVRRYSYFCSMVLIGFDMLLNSHVRSVEDKAHIHVLRISFIYRTGLIVFDFDFIGDAIRR
jgi:hypothetical protein